MLIVQSTKLLALGLINVTLGMATLGTGTLFSGYLVAASKNPDDSEGLFNSALLVFALIETFVFLSFLIGGLVYFI